ncbi:MAG: hypothetical protein CM1200mP40_20870 [Gammaproteobacteria bacterium]|nr:MAG: hypothetical protein CM1200mP40_20870 [Gammaproteobacteria bacterium]
MRINYRSNHGSRDRIKTVDIGIASFGMHSIRELAGAKDAEIWQK